MEIRTSSFITYKRLSGNNTQIAKTQLQSAKLTSDVFQKSRVQKNVSFGSSPLDKVSGYFKYKIAEKRMETFYKYLEKTNQKDSFVTREWNLSFLDGIQHGIDVFKSLSINEIQYLSENLHVIAVKRGCTHMCGHCYADAKPSNREMSYEDFHSITQGFKTLRERFKGLDIFGQNIPITKDDPMYQTTEMFYDADCIDIVLKDKKGKEYDFTDLSKELHESLGRQTVFDTSGWSATNPKLQKRAERYAEYFSAPKNMEYLKQFNVSFNVFNASYVASINAIKKGDRSRSKMLREKFVNNMANTLFTFTPVSESKNFNVMNRAFGLGTKFAKGFYVKEMAMLIDEVLQKLNELYTNDLNTEQKYVKNQQDCTRYLKNYAKKMSDIDTALNSSGRMQKFVKEQKIIPDNFQDHAKITPIIVEDLKKNGRLSNIIMHRLIDADGKFYQMDYARFIPTEVQLNISGKDNSTPKLANLVEDFALTKEKINEQGY